MAAHIRQNEAIHGLKLGTDNIKITQFVDDSTCVLNSLASLPLLLSFLTDFAQWSGFRVNKEKSMILLPSNAFSGIRALHGIPLVQHIKILGFWSTQRCSSDDHYQFNYNSQLGKIKSVCDSWSSRNLSIKGKVTLVNSLMISLLQYQCSSIFTILQVFKEY